MPLHECPGPNRKRPIVPEEYNCPACGATIEIWSNDEKTVCPECAKELSHSDLTNKA